VHLVRVTISRLRRRGFVEFGTPYSAPDAGVACGAPA
jgi:hypothetical protein